MHRTMMQAVALLVGMSPAVAHAQTDEARFDPYASLRWRLEQVEQEGLREAATASTLRVRAGAIAGPWHGLSAQLEGEAVLRVGPARFNDTSNGLTQFPVVADPSDQQLNQAVLRWKDGAIGSASLGREAVSLDNQRWIGSVDWRQNDQTLDIARGELTAIDGIRLSYGHAWQVNRVFGSKSGQGVWRDTAIHLLRAEADAQPVGAITAYAWLLDIPDAPASSSATFGARLVGRQVAGGTTILLTAELARQRDYGSNPQDFALTYLLLEPAVVMGPVTARLGYEQLGGNGRAALQTPLATLHAFNGWADKFLVTPPDGLRDLYLDISVAPKAAGLPKGMALKAVLHDFRSTRRDRPYGREFNAQLLVPLRPKLTLLAKAALYQSRGFATDTMKIWLQAEARF